MGTNIFIFNFPQKWDPIYVFCDDFFKYIGPYILIDFGVSPLKVNWVLYLKFKRIGSHPSRGGLLEADPGLRKGVRIGKKLRKRRN